jgi:uncharacterized membrane-anchored protein YhcB (DUF1043 family)
MVGEKGHLAELISSLRRQRDELALKMHLGKAELKEEWTRMTEKLDDLTREYEPLKEAVGDTADNVITSLKLVGEEIQNGFHRIRKSL